MDVEGSYAKGMMKFSSAGYVSDAEDGPGIVAANAWTRRREVELFRLSPHLAFSKRSLFFFYPSRTGHFLPTYYNSYCTLLFTREQSFFDTGVPRCYKSQ